MSQFIENCHFKNYVDPHKISIIKLVYKAESLLEHIHTLIQDFLASITIKHDVKCGTKQKCAKNMLGVVAGPSDSKWRQFHIQARLKNLHTKFQLN